MLILHWFRPKLTSEFIKCWGGDKIWFHDWLRLKKSITIYQKENKETPHFYRELLFSWICQTPPYVYAVAGGLFWLSCGQAQAAQLCRISLFKPFLTFKGHRNTVLIAQNVAKASKIDWSVYLFTQKPFVSSYFRLEWYFTYCVARNLGLPDSSDLGLGKTLTVN